VDLAGVNFISGFSGKFLVVRAGPLEPSSSVGDFGMTRGQGASKKSGGV